MDELEKELKELQNKLQWYDLFVDYIHSNDRKKYNDACEYADDITQEQNG